MPFYKSVTFERQEPEDKNFMHTTLDVATIIEDLKHELRCEELVWDEKKQDNIWTIREGTKPDVNEIGLSAIISTVKSIVNKDAILSTMDKDQIKRVCISLHVSLSQLLIRNRENFGIDWSRMDIVMQKVMNLVYVTLLRAKDGEEKKFYAKTQTAKEIRTYDEMDQKKKGLIASLFKR